jgi:hypothetical protein
MAHVICDSFLSSRSLSATGDKSLKKRINDLEMQLDTVNIKIAETEDNKRNYELNISNLKEEELENLMKLDALRRAITENLNLYRKMNALKVNALHDRAEAESEKDMFASEVCEGGGSFKETAFIAIHIALFISDCKSKITCFELSSRNID